MPPALVFESSGQFRFVHRSQLNKRQTQVGYFNRKPIQLKSFPPSADQHVWSCSCHPVQVRMAERSKAPDSRRCTFLSRGISGLRMEAWVRIPLLTWLLTSSCNIQTHSEEVNVTKDSKMDATESGWVPSCIKVDKASKEELPC